MGMIHPSREFKMGSVKLKNEESSCTSRSEIRMRKSVFGFPPFIPAGVDREGDRKMKKVYPSRHDSKGWQ
jgi:hypothetical protein